MAWNGCAINEGYYQLIKESSRISYLAMILLWFKAALGDAKFQRFWDKFAKNSNEKIPKKL
jgi:hypothetical protein